MLTVQVLVPLAITVFSLAFLNLETRLDDVPLELTLKTYGQTIVPFYISPNSRLNPQLLEYFTDMLVAEEQIPLETPSKSEAQRGRASRGHAAPRGDAPSFGATLCSLKLDEPPTGSVKKMSLTSQMTGKGGCLEMKPGCVFLGTVAGPKTKSIDYLMCLTCPKRFTCLWREFGDRGRECYTNVKRKDMRHLGGPVG